MYISDADFRALMHALGFSSAELKELAARALQDGKLLHTRTGKGEFDLILFTPDVIASKK